MTKANQRSLEAINLKFDISKPWPISTINHTTKWARKRYAASAILYSSLFLLLITSMISGAFDFEYAMPALFLSVFSLIIVFVIESAFCKDHIAIQRLLKQLDLEEDQELLSHLQHWSKSFPDIKNYLCAVNEAGRKPTLAEFEHLKSHALESSWENTFKSTV